MRQIQVTIFILMVVVIAGANVPLSLYAQDDHHSSQRQPTQLIGLKAVQAQRTVVEGKDGIEIIFDEPSAERLLRFTNGAAGRRIVFFVNRRKLATLRLLDPLKEGSVLLTGDLDSLAIDELFSTRASIDLALE